MFRRLEDLGSGEEARRHERDEVRSEAKRWKSNHDNVVRQMREMKRERDEARLEATRWKGDHDYVVRLLCECGGAYARGRAAGVKYAAKLLDTEAECCAGFFTRRAARYLASKLRDIADK